MRLRGWLLALGTLSLVGGSACSGDGDGDDDTTTSSSTLTGAETTGETGDGDGDGDGDATSGDGDGDATTGDGDGDGDFAGTLYLNFEGVELLEGSDDSKTNTTQISEMVGTAAPYGGTDEHLYVAQAVADRLSAFSIQVVIERPTSGDYTMMVITPTNPFGGNTSGIGPSDCNNANANNIGYAFYGFDSSQNAQQQASGILRIFGFTHGLENVVTSTDIMSAQAASPMPTFKDECIALASPPSGCGTQHEAYCDAGQQNSYQELQGFYPAP